MKQVQLLPHVASSRGFTLSELLISISIMSILSGITAVGFSSASQAMKGNAGTQQVRAQLRLARDLAISQRRSMEVQFIAPNEIRTIRWEIPSGMTTVNQYFLEGNVEFHRFSSVPDTPDGFGITGPVSFTGQTSRFLSNGHFVDEDGAFSSGNIFLAIQGQPSSQRAVTIFGGTGRSRAYRWDGTQWLE